MLKPGDIAPDFRLQSSSGEKLRLYELLKDSAVVLFFYPKAFTPLCTAEACSFRDSQDNFDSASAVVLGISGDDPSKLKRFADDYRLAFPLLSDPDGSVRRLYGVSRFLGLLPGRATFVVSKRRTIERVTSANFQSTPHITRSLEALNALSE